jgi:antitoxin Phd
VADRAQALRFFGLQVAVDVAISATCVRRDRISGIALDAKASLSAVVDEAVRGKPAVITRHGKRQAVVVSYEEWQRLSHVPSFGRLLMAAPLTADDLPSRNKSGLRKTGL